MQWSGAANNRKLWRRNIKKQNKCAGWDINFLQCTYRRQAIKYLYIRYFTVWAEIMDDRNLITAGQPSAPLLFGGVSDYCHKNRFKVPRFLHAPNVEVALHIQ